jgi:hypothetical protein
MRSNVIMLTAGLAGSSLVTSLLARGDQYWLGDQTFKKQDYDTFENLRLVELNEQMFRDAGFDGDYMHRFKGWPIELIARAADSIDTTPYEAFVRECESHSPFIWKDPRSVAHDSCLGPLARPRPHALPAGDARSLAELGVRDAAPTDPDF